MTEEREKATFDVREMTYFLDGGEKNTKVLAPPCLSFDQHYDALKDPMLTCPLLLYII